MVYFKDPLDVKNMCGAANALHDFFRAKGLDFLSKEGRIWCRSVIYDEQTIKIIANVGDVSLKTAHIALDSLESAGFLSKQRLDEDRRCVSVHVNYSPLINHVRAVA